MAALVLNAAIVSNLSNVANRYEARVIWLLPLATLVTAAEWWPPRPPRTEAVPRPAALQPAASPSAAERT